jgi:hypothetical protein
VLANCGFAAIFAAPKLAGLQHLGHSAAEEQQLTQKWALTLLNEPFGNCRLSKLGDVAANLLCTQTTLREGLSLLAAEIAISSQATVLAYH